MKREVHTVMEIRRVYYSYENIYRIQNGRTFIKVLTRKIQVKTQ